MADKIEQPVSAIEGSYFDITGNRIKVTSQLNLFNILQDPDSTKYMNIFRNYTLNTDILENVLLYYLHEVDHNDWWDNISYKYYQTPDLWWVIAIINGVVNPFEELEVGEVVRVLKEEYLYQIIEDIENISKL